MPTGLGDEQLWLSATNDNTGTSTAFNDQSGNGNNGTASGTLVVADTSEGGTYAYSLDGAGDFISLGNVLDSDEFDPLSYSFWMNANSTSDSYNAIMNKLNKFGTPRGHSIGYRGTSASNSGGLTFILRNSPSNNIIVSTPSGSVSGGWYHVAMTYDGSSNASGVKIYIDAVSSASAGPTDTLNGTTVTSEPYTIGSRDGNDYFDGLLDDIRQYDRVLTQAEITHLASSRGVEGPAPVGLGDEKLWFSAALAANGSDLSGNANNATISSGVTTSSPPAGSTDVAWYATGSGNSLNMDSAGAALRAASLTSGKVSISFWVLPESTTNRRTFGSEQGGAGTRLRVGRSTGGIVYSQFVSIGNYIANASNGSTTTEMTHFVMVWEDNAFARSYVNGVLQGEDLTVGAYAFGEDLAAFEYGLDGTAGGGYIDDIRGYDRILAQAEITHLATSRGIEGSPSAPPVTPDVFYNPFKSQAFQNFFLSQQRIR